LEKERAGVEQGLISRISALFTLHVVSFSLSLSLSLSRPSGGKVVKTNLKVLIKIYVPQNWEISKNLNYSNLSKILWRWGFYLNRGRGRGGFQY
jgi:hypothetical protein